MTEACIAKLILLVLATGVAYVRSQHCLEKKIAREAITASIITALLVCVFEFNLVLYVSDTPLDTVIGLHALLKPDEDTIKMVMVIFVLDIPLTVMLYNDLTEAADILAGRTDSRKEDEEEF